MSKKSRRRNKKILAAIGIGLGAAALASKKRNASIQANETKEAGFDIPPVKSTAKKETPTVKTSTTVMDSMPAKAPKNQKSKRIQKNTNKVYTIESAKKGEPAKVGNENSVFKGDDGYLRRGKDATPMTGGRFGTYKASQEMKKGALPPQLRTPKKPETFGSRNDGLSYMAKGGRAKYKSGGKVKGCGKALRGFGKAMKGNR